MENPLKIFSSKDVKTALSVHQEADHAQVFDAFDGTCQKREADLKKGFQVVIGDESDGLSETYTKGPNKSKFNVIRTILNGKNASESITGNYDIDGHEVLVSVDKGAGNPMVSARVFLDHNLISSRSSPFDTAAQMSDSFLADVVQGQEGDTSRLQKTINAENSPYPFAKKMLTDYAASVLDTDKIQEMHQKMSKKDKTAWNK